MHLKHIEIENFRAITRLSMDFASGANLLVGPNAVGKTTLLEAIRLNKAMLAPRTQQESRNVMVQLGLTSNQLPQLLNFASIAGDPSKQIVIDCSYELTDADLTTLPTITVELATAIAGAQVGIQMTEGIQPQIIQFLGSPAGQEMLRTSTLLVQDNLGQVAQTKLCRLCLTVDPLTGQFSGANVFAQLLFSTLERKLSPFKTGFSYFSADRAMPAGDIPIQLGPVDAQQQLESHNSSPGLKFQRLKNTLFSSFVESTESREEQNETFKLIFKELLKEKEIDGFSINQFGQALISIKDLRSGRSFDIDSLSSGEKGLILTFLILSKAIEKGGLVLLDEPELHLNPAVCKDLLGFLIDRYLTPLEIQAIICTHSPEILATAMRKEGCSVHHMRPGGAVSVIRRQDKPELTEAMKLLGTSEVEEMLYEAVVFVEGPDDVELLETAFPAALSRIKFRELYGRSEIEKQIKRLQEAEQNNQKENISYFLFDRDRKSTAATSSPKVIVKQWDRYCLENYLLDPEVLFDLLRREFRTTKTPQNLGEATERFLKVAKKQLSEIVIAEVYGRLAYEGPGLRREDRQGKDFDQAAEALFSRISRVRMQLAPLDRARWMKDFREQCEILIAQRQQEWSASWLSQCNGKQFIMDLYPDCGLTVPPFVLKRRLLQENKFANDGRGTESWKLLSATFADLFKQLTI